MPDVWNMLSSLCTIAEKFEVNAQIIWPGKSLVTAYKPVECDKYKPTETSVFNVLEL
jgi:hypothetical protein